MSNVSDFCESRKIPENIRDAFIAYIRSDYSGRFALKKDGDTIKLVVSKMTVEQVEEAWLLFVNDLRKVLK